MPPWPSPECVLPPGAVWTIARPRGLYPFNMAVWSKDDIMAADMRKMGRWHELDHPSMIGVRHQGVLVDVGANFGSWSLFFAAAGHRVLAIEPAPQNVALLNASLCANPAWQERIRVYPYIVGNSEQAGKHCTFYVDPQNKGNMQVACDGPKPTNRVFGGSVLVKTLQDVLDEAGVGTIDTLKIDVEGFECNVLDGIPKLLDNYHPTTIFMEIASNRKSEECAKAVAQRGGFDITIGWDAKLTRDFKRGDVRRGMYR